MANLVASLVLRLIDQMSAPARGAAKSIQTVGEAQKSAGDGAKAWSRGTDEARGKLDGLASPTRAASRAADDLGRASRGAGEGLNRLDGRLGRVPSRARAAASALGALNRAQKMGQDASKQWARGLDELDGKLGRLASASLVTDGIGRAGQALMRPLKASTGVAISYEEKLAAIGDTADMTTSQIAKMDQAIRNASKLGRGPGDIADAASIYIAGGLDGDVAGNLLGVTTKLVVGQKLAYTDAANAAMAFNQSLGVAAENMEGAFDAAAAAGKAGRFELKAMSEYLPTIGAAGARLGLSGRAGVSELTAALTTIMDKTQDEAQTANQLKDVLLKATSAQTERAFAGFGVDIVGAMDKAKAEGRSPIDALLAAVKQAESKGARVNQLFTDQEAQLGVQALKEGQARFEAVRDEANRAAGVVQTSYDRASATGAEKQRSYAASMERVALAYGEILAPAIGLAANLLERVAGWMEAAGRSGSVLGKAAVWAVAGFAGLAVAAGAVGQAMVGVLGPMLIVKSLFGTMGGAAVKRFAANVIAAFARARFAALAFNLTMLANPIVLGVAAAVAAVAIVALVVRKYWEPIKAFFGGVGQALGEAFGPSLSAIGAALAPLKPLWDGVAGAVAGFFGWFGRLLQPIQATTGQLNSAASAGQRFGRLLATVFRLSPIGLFVGGLASAVRLFRSLSSLRMPDLGQVWAGVSASAGRAWNDLADTVGRGWASARTIVTSGASGLVQLVSRFSPVVLIARAWSAVSSAVAGVWPAARAVVSAGASGLVQIVGRFSPVALIGRAWSAVSSALAGVWPAARAVVSAGALGLVQIVGRFSPVALIGRAWSAVSSTVAGVWPEARAVVSAGAGGLVQLVGRFSPVALIGRAWSAVSSAVAGVWPAARAVVLAGASGLVQIVGRFSPVALIGRAWSAVSSAVAGVWPAARAAVAAGARSAATAAYDALAGLPARFRNIGVQVIAGLIAGIRSGVANVGQAAGAAAQGAATAAKRVLGIRSPSRVFAAIGGFTMQGLAQGLLRNAAAPLAAVTAMVGAMADAAPALALPVVLDNPKPPAGPVVVLGAGAPPHDPSVPPPGAPPHGGPPPAAGASAYPSPAVALIGLPPAPAASAGPTPASAPATVQKEVHHHHRYGDITIQMTGSNVTARDVAREMARQQQAQRRGAIYDGGQA